MAVKCSPLEHRSREGISSSRWASGRGPTTLVGSVLVQWSAANCTNPPEKVVLSNLGHFCSDPESNCSSNQRKEKYWNAIIISRCINHEWVFNWSWQLLQHSQELSNQPNCLCKAQGMWIECWNPYSWNQKIIDMFGSKKHNVMSINIIILLSW